MDDPKFKYFQEKVISILDSLEKQENSEKKEVKKSLLEAEEMAKGGKGLPVGTVREWKGKKYVKIAPKKWKPKYDDAGRGAKMAIAAIKKKASACTTSQELLQLVQEYRDRFSDKNGHPLPIVKELSDYVSKRNDEIESGTREETPTERAVRIHDEYKENLEKMKAEKEENKTVTPEDKKLSNGKTIKEMREKYGIKVDEKKEETKNKDELEKPFTEADKDKARKQLNENAVKMMDIPYSKEEYEKLFPRGEVNTPFETVKLGNNQFERLGSKDNGKRKNLIGAMYQTLTEPCVVTEDFDKQGRKAKLYIKSFIGENKEKYTFAVVVDINGRPISVSFGERKEKQVLNKIKTATRFYYVAADSQTIGTDKEMSLPNRETVTQGDSNVNKNETKKSITLTAPEITELVSKSLTNFILEDALGM